MKNVFEVSSVLDLFKEKSEKISGTKPYEIVCCLVFSQIFAEH